MNSPAEDSDNTDYKEGLSPDDMRIEVRIHEGNANWVVHSFYFPDGSFSHDIAIPRGPMATPEEVREADEIYRRSEREAASA